MKLTKASLTLLHGALREWIACEIAWANAHGRMAHHAALSVRAARALARISAFLIYARQVGGTLAVADAFRSTIRRCAEESS